MLERALCSRRQLLAASVGVALSRPVSAQVALSATLFIIARSTNANIVRYDVRIDSSGRLDVAQPLQAYWVLHAEDGRHQGLSWFERKFAYGFEVLSKVEQAGFRVRLTAVEGREIAVVRSGQGYQARTRIARQDAVLKRVYVRTEEGGIVPDVIDVALSGRSVATRAPLAELLKP
jgi:hypothetical protein